MPSPDNRQRQFDVLYEMLSDIQQRFMDNNAKVAALLLLGVGWVATSKDARNFLATMHHAKAIGIAATSTAFFVYVIASLQAWWISRKTLASLSNLDFMPVEYYRERQLRLSTVLICTLGNASLAALSIALVAMI